MMSCVLLCICLCICLFNVTNSNILDTVEIKLPGYASCVSNNTYFNSLSLLCETCGLNQTPLKTSKDPWGNYYTCICKAGYYTVINDCSADSTGTCAGLTCKSCLSRSGFTSYSDGSGCAQCGSSTTGVARDNDCGCAAGNVLVEADVTGDKLNTKYCTACPAGTAVVLSDATIAGKAYTGSKYLCQACPDPNMEMSDSNVCTCKTGYLLVGIAEVGHLECVFISADTTQFSNELNTAMTVVYDDADETTVRSLTISHYYVQAAYNCKHYGSTAAIPYCQILANLCVLQLYYDQAVACETYLAIVNERSTLTYSVINWANNLPWIYYSSSTVNSVDSLQICKSDIYKQKVRFNQFEMDYTVASYTMNGTFVGFQSLQTLLTYCSVDAPLSDTGGGTSSSTFWQYFGASEKTHYKCQLDTLLGKEQLFYELFLYDRATREYSPIPVRILNTVTGADGYTPAALYPDFLCNSDDVLVRRFFLYDIISGIDTINAGTVGTPAVIRFAHSISLQTSITGLQDQQIYPTVLTIGYNVSNPNTWVGEDGTPGYWVASRYIMPMSSFHKTLNGFFIAGAVFVGLLFLLRYINFNKRNTRLTTSDIGAFTTSTGGINWSIITQYILLALHSWVCLFFPFTLLICWYFFVFFKIQKIPSTMLPPQDNVYSTDSEYYVFTCILHVIATFQIAWVTFLVYRQCNADIFFIDWEPAKPGKTDSHNVSVWRTIIAANEWAEMQSSRKTDIRFTLFWLGFFLIGLDLQYNATQQPMLDVKSVGQLNVVLRFANTTFWWLIISFGQWGWNYFIYERFFSEPQEQLFIDFCTLAKVSIIVLDEKYHGYYLHCRSPHQYADGTMIELVEMLHKEEAGLTVDRSLDGAPADVQSFEIFLTAEWRSAFDKMYSILARPQSISELIHSGTTRSRGGGGGSGSGRNTSKMASNTEHSSIPSERSLKAWKELCLYLQEFVDNNFGRSGLRRVVREQSYVEKTLNTPPDLSAPDQPCVFVPDRDFDYTKVLFLGCERDLLLMNILSYSLFDYWFNNTAVTILLTYLLDKLFCTVRTKWGRALLAKKTLVDERFLI